MGKKKGKGKSQGQTPSGGQPQEGEGAAAGPSTTQQQPRAPNPQQQQQQPKKQQQPHTPQPEQQPRPPQHQQQPRPPQQQQPRTPQHPHTPQHQPQPSQQQYQFPPPQQPIIQQRPQQTWGPRGARPQGRPQGAPPQQLPSDFQQAPRMIPPGFPPSFQQSGVPPGLLQGMTVQGQPQMGLQSPPPTGMQGQPQSQQPTGPHIQPTQQQFRGPPGITSEPSSTVSPPPGPPRGQQQPLSFSQQQQRGGPQQQRGGPQQQRGDPQQQRGGPQQQRGDPQLQKGDHQQQRGDPQQQRQQQVIAPPPGGQGDCMSQTTFIKPGTKGRRIPVESNHLSLNMGKLMQAVHYDVTITPDTPKALLRDVMNNFGKEHYPDRYPAFDGRKNLYSPTKLNFGPTDSISGVVKVEGENRTKEFKVEIKFARFVDLSPLHNMMKSKQSPQDALQCLDIVLRNAPSNRCITAGRCFFTPPRDQILSLGDGMEMYYGFYQSAIRGWTKPLLNVDVAHKAFPSSLNLLDLICELGSDFRHKMQVNDLSRPIRDDLQRDLEKFLRMLKVKYEITGQSSSKRIYRVNGLGLPPSKAQFKLENGQVTTVERYFQDVKRTKLRYPHLPTVWVGAKDRESKILVPLEFCMVVGGQAVNRKMNENQTSAMIKKSATSTQIRKDKIMRSLDEVRYNNDPCIREFGFSVGNQFEKLDARVLVPPNLRYADKNVVTPSRGTWRADRAKFLQGATINKWTIVSATRYPPRDIAQLADQIARMAPAAGMHLSSKAIQPFQHVGGRQTVPDFIDYFKTKQDFDLIFVVVPNSGQIYSYVKQAAELGVGCLTQCIKERTLMKLNPQTVGNILLKVNSKLNGTNHVLLTRPSIMNRPCMIMGADVTHPSPDAKDIPSVAAVTASHDPQAFQYNICWRLQPPKVEIIEDLCNITKEQLLFFYRKTNCKPERIVFFRDGVSEGQFREVMHAEILAIQNACRQLQKEEVYQPKITFLVVQKRHHTRLFPTNPRDSEDKNTNVPAGTCVDTTITNPMMQDFYLVSHASIQGVAKPTKYCTLWDDNKMDNDDIEELTYHLCHLFTRCNRSVSYPAPTYYAHLAAARAKVYIENDKLNMDELNKHQGQYQIKECIAKGKPMFFV